MSDPGTPTSSQTPDGSLSDDVVDWSDLAGRMWTFLTGREAAIHYSFEDMAVEVPRDTGLNAPRATWKFNGTLTITTSDDGKPVAPGRA